MSKNQILAALNAHNQSLVDEMLDKKSNSNAAKILDKTQIGIAVDARQSITIPIIPNHVFGNDPDLLEAQVTTGTQSDQSSTTNKSALDFGKEWMRGEGKDYILRPGDHFADQLLQHESVKMAYEESANQIKNGKQKGAYYYSVAGTNTLTTLPKDLVTIGWGLFTGKEFCNSAATYFGSYEIGWEVISRDPETGITTVQFIASNTMSVGTATRLPFIGYTKEWQEYVEVFLRENLDKYLPPQKIEVIWTRNFMT